MIKGSRLRKLITPRTKEVTPNANAVQVGGTHYKALGDIQPWDMYWHWNLNAFQASILKYVVRYRDKEGVQDLEKARHYIDKLIELENEK